MISNRRPIESPPSVLVLLLASAIEGGGGAERRFGRLFSHLRRMNYPIFLLCSSNVFAVLQRAHVLDRDDANIIVWRHHTILWKSLRTLIEDKGIDLVHFPLLQGRLLPLLFRLQFAKAVPITASVNFSAFGAGSKIPLQTRLAARLLFRRAILVDSLYRRFLERYGARLPNKVRISPCSFTDPFHFLPATRKENLVVFAGRLIPEKNPLAFVEAVAKLRSRRTLVAWRFLILGDGPLGPNLDALILRQELNAILERQKMADIGPALGLAKIFVSLQENENYPSQSLLEAMSCEAAVVATDVGETRRIVDSSNGELVASANPDLVASALEELMFDSQKCERLGRSARERVLREFTVERYSDYMVGFWVSAWTRRHGK